ncbi:phage tail protein [Streptomyces kanamyceticus]|uniref:Phage tail protein n=1 Tax=Streptomyces kanamyceticus TaxID=1967 RepID=A0A5J6GMI3_STRKN|nr:phage tail protein [Streptomyces kanamyceticus]QEU96639.1 phage tail protein [Streptomyces kanamyceticus]
MVSTPQARPHARDVLQTFRFEVTLTDSPGTRAPAATDVRNGSTLGNGSFQECGGLDLQADVREYLEGGRNDGVIRRVGRVKLEPLVLKRGMFARSPGERIDPALWTWLQDMVAGNLPVRRIDGTVHVFASLHEARQAPLATWRFVRGLPSRITGPSLNARTGEIAVEELHIVHEGLRLVS